VLLDPPPPEGTGEDPSTPRLWRFDGGRWTVAMADASAVTALAAAADGGLYVADGSHGLLHLGG
jgi:hypothetical protein